MHERYYDGYHVSSMRSPLLEQFLPGLLDNSAIKYCLRQKYPDAGRLFRINYSQ